MNVLSLFSGIGGLELGLERAGMTVVGQVEINPYCQQVLSKHWPDVPRHDDVRTAGQWWQSQPRPTVHVVAGGFPCQPFSNAGAKKGVADERWGWPWMRDVIDTVRPTHVVIENVAALLRDADAFSIILGDLSDLGFDAEWDVVSACSVGAPHSRRRLFVVAYPAGLGLEGRQAYTPQGGGVEAVDVAGQGRLRWPQVPEPDAWGVPHGFADRVERTTAVGNAVVPAVAEFVGRRILAVAA